MNGKTILYLLVLGYLLTGCYSASIMQTAKTVEKGKVNFSGAVSLYGPLHDDPPLTGGANVALRYGIANRTDIGLSYASGLWGHARLDMKQNLWKSSNSNSYFSTGFAFDMTNVGDNGFTNGLAISVPLFFSINHNKPVTIYSEQRFALGMGGISLLRDYDYYKNDYVCSGDHLSLENWNFYTGGIGLKWGKKEKLKWCAELSYVLYFRRFVLCEPGSDSPYNVGKPTYLTPQLSIGLSFGNH